MWATLALLLCLAAPAATGWQQGALVVGAPARAFDLAALNPRVQDARDGEKRVALHDLVGMEPLRPARGVVVFFFDRGESSQGVRVLDAMSRRYRNQKVRFLGICLDNSDTTADWIRSLDLSFPILADPFRVVAGRYEVPSLPFLVLVDAEARVFSAGGPEVGDFAGALETEIANLLVHGPPARE
ncbi:MAG: TlpA family protein disulfide reductase [Deltaproteobacteria bacterium]|nr:TlpA family protein disulfide reductase [Deltaproteobacteria bacterium]